MSVQEDKVDVAEMVVDASCVSFIDSTGLKVLMDIMLGEPAGLHMHVLLANPSQALLALFLGGAGVFQDFGEQLY